jgi:hypothetical protein
MFRKLEYKVLWLIWKCLCRVYNIYTDIEFTFGSLPPGMKYRREIAATLMDKIEMRLMHLDGAPGF